MARILQVINLWCILLKHFFLNHKRPRSVLKGPVQININIDFLERVTPTVKKNWQYHRSFFFNTAGEYRVVSHSMYFVNNHPSALSETFKKKEERLSHHENVAQLQIALWKRHLPMHMWGSGLDPEWSFVFVFFKFIDHYSLFFFLPIIPYFMNLSTLSLSFL